MQKLKFFGSQKYFDHLYGKEVEKLGKSNTGERLLRITNRYSSRRPGYFEVENPFYKSPEKIAEQIYQSLGSSQEQQTESGSEEQEKLLGLEPEKLDVSSLTIPTTQPSQPGRSLQEMVTEMRSKQQQEDIMRMPTIKGSRSQAQRTGLSMKGATGYFGRKGQRISSINM